MWRPGLHPTVGGECPSKATYLEMNVAAKPKGEEAEVCAATRRKSGSRLRGTTCLSCATTRRNGSQSPKRPVAPKPPVKPAEPKTPVKLAPNWKPAGSAKRPRAAPKPVSSPRDPTDISFDFSDIKKEFSVPPALKGTKRKAEDSVKKTSATKKAEFDYLT